MLLRSSFIALSLGLFACSFDSPAPMGSTESKQTSHEAGDDVDEHDVTAGTSQNALDGTWDITATGDMHAVSAMMTIKGGHVTGDIILPGEGEEAGSGCTLSKNRWHFEVTVTDDELTGNYTRQIDVTGDCGGSNRSHFFTGTRKHAEANAKGQTPVEGEWVFQTEDGEERTGMTVAGLAAELYGARDPKRAVALGTSGTTTSLKTIGGGQSLSYAARKR